MVERKQQSPISQIKSGISIRGLKPEMAVAHTVVTSIFTAWGYDTIITSGTSGIHGRASLHYVGYALDYRIRHVKEGVGELYDDSHEMTNEALIQERYWKQADRDDTILTVLELITAQIDDALGNDFDVVLEATHIHVEFQPKGAINV